MLDSTDEIAGSIRRKVDEEFGKISKEYTLRLDKDTKSFRENLEKQVRGKVIAVATTIVSLAVIAIVGTLYSATRDVNNAVIALQKDIISAQAVVREATKELETARGSLVKVKAETESAKTTLDQTKEEYIRRLEGLKKKAN